jgi:heterodisulfide reductase subunit D
MADNNKALKNVGLYVYSCRKCGQCANKVTDAIPYVCPVREKTPGFDHFYARGKNVIAQGLLEEEIEASKELAEVAYSCTLCGNCMDKCGAIDQNTGAPLVDSVKIVEAMREDLLTDHPEWVDPAYKALLTTTQQYDNPWGLPRSVKGKLEKKLSLPNALKKPPEVLLFVGCTAASNPIQTERVIRASEILKKADVNLAVLGKDEPCCGSVQKRVGASEQAREMMNKNIHLFNKTGCKTIVTLCAGCANALKNDYSNGEEKLKPRVYHIVEFLAQLIKQDKLKFSQKQNKKVTYHDPCHLGRHMGVYDAPREILKALPGVELVERTATRNNTICCGAGGGMRIFESGTLAVKIGEAAIESALQTGAEELVSACPFCEMNLEASGKALNSQMPVLDIIDLVYEAV